MTLDDIEREFGPKARKAAEEIGEQGIRAGATMAFQSMQAGQFMASNALTEMHSRFLRVTLDEIARQIDPPRDCGILSTPVGKPSGTSEGR